MSKCKVIAVANQKGGVGKATTTENVAIDLARNGNEVLIVYFDPQGDLTACLGQKNNDSLDNTVSTMLDDYINDKDINYASLILKHEEDVDVIPANIELTNFEMRIVFGPYPTSITLTIRNSKCLRNVIEMFAKC